MKKPGGIVPDIVERLNKIKGVSVESTYFKESKRIVYFKININGDVKESGIEGTSDYKIVRLDMENFILYIESIALKKEMRPLSDIFTLTDDFYGERDHPEFDLLSTI